jgi:hypothetical protein
MILIVLYHLNDENTRSTDEFIADISSRTDKKIITYDIDSSDGMNKASLYGIVEYPAIIVTADDGSLHNFWQGRTFPSVAEVIGYLEA